MRRAEIVAGIVIALFSVYTAWLSTALPISWVKGRGPGGGTFPFYLSLIMLVCAVMIVARALRGRLPAAWAGRRYFEPLELKSVALHAGSVVAAVASIYVVGVYGAIMFLLVTHMRFIGTRKHSWALTIAVALVTPVVIFLFFEILMQQVLPKGYTEPLFDPLFEFFNAG